MARSDVVEMADGAHLLQVTEYVPEQAEPLAWVYTTVAYDEALDKSQRMTRHTADSLAQVIRTPEQAHQVARQLGLDIRQYRHRPGGARPSWTRGWQPDGVPLLCPAVSRLSYS